jgi:CSLREA domain-containing protein
VPAASNISVNSLADVANGGDGLCTLREAITAANSNTASGATAGECAAGSGGSDVINLTTMTPTQFVDRLNQNTGGVLSLSERTTAINLFGGAGNTSNVTARAQALRLVADDTDLYNAEFNRAFVLAQYFGYLRRNPNDAPDSDYTGYDFWLTKLNQFNGSYINAEMVKAFLSSIEYRQRFGP